MTIRLTTDMKDTICRAVIKHAFKERDEVHAGAGDRLLRDVHAAHFTKEQHEALLTLDKAGLINRVASMELIYLNDGVVEVKLFDGLLIPWPRATDRWSRARIRPKTDHLEGRVQQYAVHDQKMRDDKEEAEATLSSQLKSVSTMGALLTQWPELRPLIPAEFLKEPNKLPAIPRDKLNQQFNLPVEKTK